MVEMQPYTAIAGSEITFNPIHQLMTNDKLLVAPVLPFHSQVQKGHSPNLGKCISEVVGIGSIIIFPLSKLCKARFFLLCDVIFLVRLQGK